MNQSTRVFLVLLRLVIGWHFFFEGIEKIRSVDLIGPSESNRPWSSRAYLREATGPAGDFFRGLAGDPDQEALEFLTVKPLGAGEDPARVEPRQRISPALDKAWDEYFRRFKTQYKLDEEQTTKAQSALDQAKDQAVRWLLGGGEPREMDKAFGGTAVKVKMTAVDRLAEYRSKLRELHDALNEKLPAFGRDVVKQQFGPLKAEINKLRTELLADLEKHVQDGLAAVLTDDQKKMGPVAAAERSRVWQWERIDWIDAMTRYGLTLVGACLLLGLFTRAACVGGAMYLLLFYVAMPALPWVPDNPRAEGHYIFINKNIIEMLALLALATMPTGRWAGLDGLFHCMLPSRWRSKRGS